MKRSEMIEILADEIDNIIEAYMTRESLIERANYLLTKLEDIGVLPPKRKITHTEQEGYINEIKICFIDEWEPEDERSDSDENK